MQRRDCCQPQLALFLADLAALNRENYANFALAAGEIPCKLEEPREQDREQLMTEMKGSCYCGNISVHISCQKTPEHLTPRACDCGFCTMNGAAWVSVKDATMKITIQNEAALSLFEQGSESARFWLCQRCGVVTAVTCDIEGTRKGAFNARIMNCFDDFAPTEPASPKTLSKEEKLDRWNKLWIGNVKVKDCWTTRS